MGSEMCIRDRISPIGPLSLQMEPPSPTLEQLWEGQVDLSLQGPNGYSSEISVAFSGAIDEAPSISQALPPIPLPFQADDWRYHFNAMRTSGQEPKLRRVSVRILGWERKEG